MNKVIVKNRGQEGWHIVFALFFAFLVGCSLYFFATYMMVPQSIPVLDLILIACAVFRLIRLFVYDDVAQFVRDVAFDEKTIEKNGDEYYVKTTPQYGFKYVANELITCPWCMGIWLSWLVICAYFITPYAWFVILILAVAGIASTLQVMSNVFVALYNDLHHRSRNR